LRRRYQVPEEWTASLMLRHMLVFPEE